MKILPTAIFFAAAALSHGCKAKKAVTATEPRQIITENTSLALEHDTTKATETGRQTETYTYDSLGRLEKKEISFFRNTKKTTTAKRQLTDSMTGGEHAIFNYPLMTTAAAAAHKTKSRQKKSARPGWAFTFIAAGLALLLLTLVIAAAKH